MIVHAPSRGLFTGEWDIKKQIAKMKKCGSHRRVAAIPQF
jgi:hypothetical protein